MPNPYVYPRPEYPRPDRQRSTIEGHDWLNLNGPWQFRFDGDRRGVEEGWFAPGGPEWREQIIVPFCWESLSAWGEGDAAGNDNYYATRVYRNPLEVTRINHRAAPRYEIGWYRRLIEVPDHPAWKDKRVILTIGAADFFTDAWCNGIHLGNHEGGYTPFEFDVTDALERSADGKMRGLIVLRVEDPIDNQEQPVGKQWRWYTTASGIWQTVFLEPRSTTHIDSFRIETEIQRAEAAFTVECIGTDETCQLEVEITPPAQGEMIRVTIPVDNGTARGRISISPLLLWNPNEPYLYRTKLVLRRGEVTEDLVRTYFGMRQIDTAPTEDPVAPAALRLNGVPRYLRGALYQSYYPEGVYTAGDVQRMKNDILYAKKVGFNFLRIHIKVDDPLLLYYADLLGILIMADFPNFGEGGDTPLGRRRFEQMMRETIKRDYNHPSIFAWCLFNETWGFGGQVEFIKLFANLQPRLGFKSDEASTVPSGVSASAPLAAASVEAAASAAATAAETSAPAMKRKLANLSSHGWVQSIWKLAKALDPTRLIEDMSVVHWEHLDYFAHGDTDINSWHFYSDDYWKAREHIEKVVRATFTGSPFNYVDGFRQQSQPLINSEYGGVGALDGDRDVSWTFKFLTNELRRHGQISAYIYTELHDVEWEFNGFLNYDRTAKDFGYDPTIINESDVLPIDSPPVVRCRPGETVRVPVASSHYSTHRREHVVLRWRLAGVDSCGRTHQDLAGGSAPIPFPHRRMAAAHTIEIRMPETPMLCTLSVEAHTAEGVMVARNFNHYFVAETYPPTREETARSLILRGTPGDWDSSTWSGRSGQREQFVAEDCCFGFGHGHFEWVLPLKNSDLHQARRIRVLCEASARRIDTPQTDEDNYPTTLQVLLNSVPAYEGILRNHPHDSRGVLSYWRGARGAYGYLIHATAEGELLRQIVDQTSNDLLRLRCEVPGNALAQGGLSIYGAECGRYPICPTVIIEH
jgi:hypothetical protein